MSIFDKKSSEYKLCEEKIKELCGGFIANDDFINRASKYKSTDNSSNTFEKSILKHECKNQTLSFENIESRLDELLQLDAETLDLKIRMKGMDTSIFKTQEDIENFMGPTYTQKYHNKLVKIENKRLKKDEKRFKAIKEHNIFTGIKAKIVFPEKEIKLKYVDNTITRGFATRYFGIWGLAIGDEIKQEEENRSVTTLLQVVEKGIVLKNASKDGKDLRIPYESIVHVEKRNDFLDLILLENQVINIKFDFGLFSLSTKEFVDGYFIEIINSRACGEQFEEDGWGLEYDDSTNNLNNDSNLKNQYGADELLKWYELYEKGVITSEELQQKKNEIMGGKEISSIKSNLENNHLSFVFCTNCGARLTSESKFCANCGERIIE